MKRTRFLAVLFSLALVFAFVACGDDDDNGGGTSSSSDSSAGVDPFEWPTGTPTFGNANESAYVFTNIDLDGGIKAVSDSLWDGNEISTETTVTGVVTYIDSHYGDTCYIQDKDAALYLYGGGISVKPIEIGDMISVTLSASGAYGQAPQVTGADLVEKISTGNKPYLRTSVPAAGEGRSLLTAFVGVVKEYKSRAVIVTVGNQDIELYSASYAGVNKGDLPAELVEGANVLVIGAAHAKDGMTQVLVTDPAQLLIW